MIVNLLWTITSKLLPFGAADAEMINMLMDSLILGIAVVWLLADKLGNRNRFVTFLLALSVMLVFGFAGIISYSALEFSQKTIGYAIIFIVIAIAMLVGFALAGRQCRKYYSGPRFALWLCVCNIAACMILLLVYFAVVFIAMMKRSFSPSISILILFQLLMVGVILGLIIYVINLPFIILALRSGFFRKRFCACFRLKSMSKITEPPTQTNQADEQKQPPKVSETNNSA